MRLAVMEILAVVAALAGVGLAVVIAWMVWGTA